MQPLKLFSLLVTVLACPARAQLSIETLDSFAAEIRMFEHAAEGETYNDGDHDYALSFADESFGFSYSNGLAWKAVDKRSDATFTCITENIDLASATGMLIDFRNK